MPKRKILSTLEASAALGVIAQRVRHLCKAGRIVGARKVGRDWVIPAGPDGLPIVTPGRRGRPPKVTRS